jgi:hypothetical protein
MSKTTFSLKNINIAKINQKYNLESENITNFEDKNITKTTKIVDLNNDKINDTISFLDESKRIHKCHIIYIDYNTQQDISTNKYSCFWDRHPIETKPIGCPIKYIPKQAIKTYYSHISKDTYTIKDNISKNKEVSENININIIDNNFYESDGAFCSFNCVMSYINENKNNPLYKLSKQLLLKIYNETFNTKCQIISPSPSWRLLENYGGFLTISKYRESMSKLDYDYQGETHFISIGRLYEEKIKF